MSGAKRFDTERSAAERFDAEKSDAETSGAKISGADLLSNQRPVRNVESGTTHVE